MEELVSVIVPIYNTEKYLVKCVTSIQNQTYKNIEILLINDGSTDGSGDICDRLSKNDSRIKVIHKENTGPGNCKNLGIHLAKGEILAFTDSDDFVDDDWLEILVDCLHKEKTKILISSFYYINEDEEKLDWKTPFFANEVCLSKSEAIRMFLRTNNIGGFAWNKIYYKKEFIDNKIFFAENVIFEDIFTIFSLLVSSSNVAVSNKKKYYYRQNKNSLVHSLTGKKIIEYCNAIKKVKELAIKEGYEIDAEFYYSRGLINVLYRFYKDKENRKTVIIQEKREWRNILKYKLFRIEKDENETIKEYIKLYLKFFVTILWSKGRSYYFLLSENDTEKV